MKSLYTIFVVMLFSSFVNAQDITSINPDDPYYLLDHPTHLEVNEVLGLKDHDIDFVRLEGSTLQLFNQYKERTRSYELAFESDFKTEQACIVKYSVVNSNGNTLKVAYEEGRSNTYKCTIFMYDKNETLIMKVASDRILDSFYF
ncbi:hypothetical protein [Flammeovirga kamogawensis]|uniref:DUF4252 domain-containing protein n=1 Tax=Flammeovirga kamogawensis TaxID=373891 RepID=A0ABX8GTB0_9BACT|nr:hypothetical protein [Flammeovirga kamogawensis]MBB6462466.1 hypothetical protein [Flammeovirga kamogawensis]QWG06796.1 hypothetical protein KM029_16020 [Flammeovirga kamogawensis]TRX68619.1 hypothetical protein EO216_11015 [Flammeovirga kamogawensis]